MPYGCPDGEFVERALGDVPDPLPPGKSPSGCSAEHGRFDAFPDEIADVDDPDMAAKVNASWLRMAIEHGLLNDEREFLIRVDYRDYEDASEDREEVANEDETHWVRVRLLATWDIAASGVPQLRSGFAQLFTRRFVPEFTAVSLDGRTLLEVTVWGNGTVSTIAIRSAQDGNATN
jgi:hypothetical protein